MAELWGMMAGVYEALPQDDPQIAIAVLAASLVSAADTNGVSEREAVALLRHFFRLLRLADGIVAKAKQ
jgi:hypothetical protein